VGPHEWGGHIAGHALGVPEAHPQVEAARINRRPPLTSHAPPAVSAHHHLGHVEASGQDVCRYQDLGDAVSELGHDSVAIGALHASLQGELVVRQTGRI